MIRSAAIDHWRRVAFVVLLTASGWQLTAAAWIDVKAIVAQYLISFAWSHSTASGAPVRPWPWADTWPVARLRVPDHGKDLYVLAGAGGHALAFGPGLELASAMPGEPGVSVIGGHRDTHFAFLRHLRLGTLLQVERAGGQRQDYRVTGRYVVNASRETLPLQQGLPTQLLLVTCYPFDAVRSGGALRYVVSARPVVTPRPVKERAAFGRAAFGRAAFGRAAFGRAAAMAWPASTL